MRRNRIAERAGAAAIVGLSIVALCAPLLLHGPLPQGSDVLATVHRLQGFMKAFGEGDLYPRWTDATNQGLGAPTFVLFPPLCYYGAGAASWLAGSLAGGLKLYLCAVAGLTALSCYLLARDLTGGPVAAALAAALYLLLPYHVLDVYQRFALSETTAFVFFPLILLSARRLSGLGAHPGTGVRRAAFAGLALSYAGLIYTHLVSSHLFTLLLTPWLLWEHRRRWRSLAAPALALGCGLTMAAPVLLPAMVETSHVNISWVREMPNGDFRINFIFKDEVLPGLGFKDPVKPPVLRSAHSQLLLAAIAAAVVLARVRGRDRRRQDAVALSIGCAVAYLLQLEISTPVWLLVPELATIQFPWRFQTIMVLVSSLLAGLAWAVLRGEGTDGRPGRPSVPTPIALAGLGLAVLVNLPLAWQNAHLKPFSFDDRGAGHPSVIGWNDIESTPRGLRSYRTFKQAVVDVPAAAFVEGPGEARVVAWESARRRLEVDSPGGGLVRIRSFWFPGWAAYVSGERTETGPGGPWAAASFPVPPGRHEVELRFEPTPVRRAAAWAGWAALAALAVLVWRLPRLLTRTRA